MKVSQKKKESVAMFHTEKDERRVQMKVYLSPTHQAVDHIDFLFFTSDFATYREERPAFVPGSRSLSLKQILFRMYK